MDPPRHSALVRVTHWITALSFLGLFVSGIAILLAHPRLYWGETGAVGTPSLIDLPLPFVLDVPIRGPGRYLHFPSAWVCVLTGLVYIISGSITLHFRKNLLPAKTDPRLEQTLTYAAQRVLMSRHSLAREFNRSEISKVAPVNGKPPENDPYQRLLAGGFADWRPTVDGLVARPSSFSLAELKGFPSRSQITHQACEEGWSFIAEWTGVPLSYVLNLVGASRRAKYVVFVPFDKWWESIDMADARHPQTFLAHGMNGQGLPTPHGAPVRLKVARQLGYKSVKYLSHMTVVDTVKNVGKGLGGANPEDGYSWYAGI